MKFYVLARVSGENYSVSIESRRDGLRVAQDVVLGEEIRETNSPAATAKNYGYAILGKPWDCVGLNSGLGRGNHG